MAKDKELGKKSIKFIKEILEETEGKGKYRNSERFCKLVEEVADSHGFEVVGEGTNRIIVENENGNVLKIAHSKMGFIDNKFEKLITEGLNTISPKVKDRFAKTICHDINSSFFIEQKKEKCITDLVDADGSGKKAANAVKYLIKRYDDYVDMITQVSKYYVPTDVYINRFRNIGETDKLIIIDYGYLIPLHMLEGIELENGVKVSNGKLWCHCATEEDIEDNNKDKRLRYYLPNIDKMMKDAGAKKGDKIPMEVIERITSKNSPEGTEKFVCKKCGKKFPARILHEDFIDAIFKEEKEGKKKKKK